MKKQIKQLSLNSLLFSGLGLFSYFLLVDFGQLPIHPNREAVSIWAIIVAMVVFNILGFTVLRLSQWVEWLLSVHMLKRMRLPIIYVLAAVLLLAINFAILIGLKWMLAVPNPLVFKAGGYKILFVVWLVELVVVSLLLMNRFTKNALHLQRVAARLQQENDNAKYEALQSQLNPHFLFNSLNTLVSEIEYNPESAVRFTRELSDVYRYVLQCQQKRIVRLADEIEFLNSYIYLHQVRLGECIAVDNRIALECDLMIAPLSLQLLAENVIKHNVINDENPMDIVLKLSENKEFMVVSNTYRPKISAASSGIGLRNLSNRYQLLCGKPVVVGLDELTCVFEVKIPLIDAYEGCNY